MPKIRLVHFYLGVFFAPLILFFAFTGILQVFRLHESYRATPGGCMELAARPRIADDRSNPLGTRHGDKHTV